VKLLALLLLVVPAAAGAAQTRAFVATTDFGSGAISTVELGPPRTAVIDRAAICSDAALRYAFGKLYVIERFGCDDIRVLDPVTCGLINQFSVGNGANPNDIVVIAPKKAYVTRYDKPDLWIVDPSSGAFLGSISLAPFADRDGIPEMNRMTYHAGRVFVSCQRLDRDNFFSPTDSSLVVVIDAATDAVVDADPVAPGVQGILLPRTNPTTEFATTPEGNFLLGCTGAYGAADGGVVRLDPRTFAVDVEVGEAALGGDVNDVCVSPGATGLTRAFCVISDASFNTNLVAYERSGPPAVTTVHPGAGFVLADAEVDDRDEVWLCDRTASAPGMRVFDAATLAQLTVAPIGTGLPPNDLCFDATEPIGVAPVAAAPAGLRIEGIAPNPAAGAARVAFALPLPGTVSLAVVDVAGRIVRKARFAAAGPASWTWDGRDEAGQAAPAGVYLVRARLDGRPEIATARLVRVRL
jgi:hypothetical protein